MESTLATPHRADVAEGPQPPGHATAPTRRFVRGSSLLLVGRFVSLLLNFVVQVLTVRYLAKEDYGAFAYGLGVASFGSSLVLFGLGKGIARLVPLYHERGDHPRAFGSIVLASATIWALGVVLVASLWALRETVGREANLDAAALSLLVLLGLLGPLEAYDNLLQHLAAAFCPARTIFFRRQVFGPGFRLAAIALVAATGGGVFMLAYGYLLGYALGIALYLVSLAKEWRKQGLLHNLLPGTIRLPVRELFGFSLPLVSTDLSVALRGSVVVIVLGYFHDASAVAEVRAVYPIAHLNMVVFDAFALLFVPLASRMFARDDHEGIGNLFWVTSLWIAVLTFPVFVATTVLAPSLTTFLFGPRYAQAGTLLAIMAIGHYVNAALGFNAATLRVHGKLRYIVAADSLTALLSVVLAVVLVKRYGAVGAAVSTTLTLVLQNVFNHVGLWLGRTGVRLFAWPFVRVYVLIAAAISTVAVGRWVFGPPAWALVAVAALLCVMVVRVSRRALDPRGTFPELLKIPMVRWLLA